MPQAFGMKTMVGEKKTALRAYILKQRQKKKEEEEQDEALRNERKRLAEKKLRDQHTLEEVNTQIVQLEKKLGEYKQEKHDLFAQLKKVLHQEDEQRKRIQQIQEQHAKDASEILAKVGPAAPPLPLLGVGSPREEIGSIGQGVQSSTSQQLPGPILAGSSIPASSAITSTAVKRQRSPSPSTSSKDGASYSGFFSPPKRINTTFQRPPYPFGPDVHSSSAMGASRLQQGQASNMNPSSAGTPLLAPGVVSMGIPPSTSMHFPAYMPPGVGLPHSSLGVGNSSMQPPRQIFRAPHDLLKTPPMVNVASAGPPPLQRPAPSVPPVNIPVIPPQKRMGSITSGYPVHKPPHVSPPAFQRPFFNPRGNPFPHPGHRFM